jgi:hypothetical protein
VHDVLHAEAPHAKPLHGVDDCTHAPAALHVPTGVCALPAHDAVPHAVALVG